MGTVVATISAASAGAQIRQYTPPGGAANEAAGRKKGLELAVADARWNLGKLRLDPAFPIRLDHRAAQRQCVAGNRRVRSDGHLTSAAQAAQESAFGKHRLVCRCVADSLEQ